MCGIKTHSGVLCGQEDGMHTNYVSITSHNSRIIIGIAHFFAKTLIDKHLKSTLKIILQLKITLKLLFPMIIGPLVSIK